MNVIIMLDKCVVVRSACAYKVMSFGPVSFMPAFVLHDAQVLTKQIFHLLVPSPHGKFSLAAADPALGWPSKIW